MKSVQAQPCLDDIVVVDNSLNKSNRDAAENVCHEAGVRLIRPGSNLGFAAACNLAVREFGPDIDKLLFINPDARVSPEAINALEASLADDPQFAALNPTLYLPDASTWFAGGSLNRQLARLVQWGTTQGESDPVATTEWVNGCVLMVRRDAFLEVGGFDERYFLYWEDVVLSLRLREAGWRIGVLADASATHIRGEGGIPIDAISAAQLEHSLQSRLIFIRNELRGAEKGTALAYTSVNTLRLVHRAHRGNVRVSDALQAAARGFRGART